MRTHIFSLDFLSSYAAPLIAGVNVITNYFFDADREPSSIQRSDQQVISYTYDNPFNRIKRVGTNSEFVNYSYDSDARITQITSSDDINITYDYDGTLITNKKYQFGGVVINHGISYSNPGLLVESESTNNVAVNKGYDLDQMLIQVGNMTANRQIDSGLIQTTSLGNIATAYTYSQFAELESHTTNFLNSVVFKEAFIRDALARVIQKIETINNVDTVYNYTYDLTGRLIEVRINNIIERTYAYDANSNRVSVNAVASTYDAQDRIKTSAGNTYTFTSHGDVATKSNASGVMQYSYDVFGQLKSVTFPNSAVISYKIDGENKRFARLINNVVDQYYSYNINGQLVGTYNPDGSLQARYEYLTPYNQDYVPVLSIHILLVVIRLDCRFLLTDHFCCKNKTDLLNYSPI